MKTKVCSKCREEKDEEQFYKNITKKDGLHNQCRVCMSLGMKLYTSSGKARKVNRNNNLKGLCKACIHPRLATSKYCLYHFVYRIILNWDLEKNERDYIVLGLIKKLEDSEYCCHYSGLKITPGFSASIDHRIPQSKGGTHELVNLVWCHTQINKLKSDETEKEFINRSANILVELNYLDSKGQL